MDTDEQQHSRDLNKSAYVSLLCLIAFVLVISICLFKQFVWDSFLSRYIPTVRSYFSRSESRKPLTNNGENAHLRLYGSSPFTYSNDVLDD